MDKHIVVLLVVMAVGIVYSQLRETKNNKKYCIICITLMLGLFSGLRSWWMGDLIKYYTLYTQCAGANGWARVWVEFGNAGIRLFFWAMGSLGISYDVCIFLIAMFSAAALGMVVFRYSPSPYWSYLMYIAMGFYLFTYSGLKQTIAMGFLMFAAIGIFETKPKKFLLWTAVAAMFHAPALIFLAAYPVAKKRIDLKYIGILCVVVAGMFVFRNQIVSWLMEAYYEESGQVNTSATIGGRMLMMILILVLGLFLRPAQNGDAIYRQTLNLMVVGTMLQFFSLYGNEFTRLADYYLQFIVLFVPLMLETGGHQLKARPKYKVKQNAANVYLPLYIGITIFALWFYSGTIEGSQLFLREYRFVWEINPYDLYGH